MPDFIGFVVLGGLAGFMVSKRGSGAGFGRLFDVMLGMAGGILGGWFTGAVLGTLGHIRPGGLFAEFLVAVIAAWGLVAVLHAIVRGSIRTS